MRNVTITLDEKTAAWARLEAARRGVSVSRMVGELLHQSMRERREYEQAMRRFLSKPALAFRWKDGRRPGRDEIHERDALR